jgi:ribosome assembly protein YihI (activator of Der GTPase)
VSWRGQNNEGDTYRQATRCLDQIDQLMSKSGVEKGDGKPQPETIQIIYVQC